MIDFISPFKLKELGILGMNARNIDFISRYNSRKYYPLVDDKLQTKLLAEEHGINTPELLLVIRSQSDIKRYKDRLNSLSSFVIKPARGSGGKGIMVIVGKDGHMFIKSSGAKIDFDEISRHLSNTLAGLHSLSGDQDVAIVETLIELDPIFEPYSYQGVPDIRIIVFRGYPVMAMLRLSTKASDGKANLHQGAVGVGIDIKSAKAINAVVNGVKITHHPDTKHSFEAIEIPNWPELLELASSCYDITHLGYFGADIVLDKNRGAMLLELNARPGLAIQIANSKGLLKPLKEIQKIKTIKRDPRARVSYVLD
ncbi:MAG: alpha-L-glutamate ligase-like protein [Sulfurimonas sp.]|jgi:alpha-L-glutamate ligase-like protein|nr:alpha-L-glutamate ligase-like protein [Sulfurimonadaceae bacterium]